MPAAELATLERFRSALAAIGLLMLARYLDGGCSSLTLARLTLLGRRTTLASASDLRSAGGTRLLVELALLLLDLLRPVRVKSVHTRLLQLSGTSLRELLQLMGMLLEMLRP